MIVDSPQSSEVTQQVNAILEAQVAFTLQTTSNDYSRADDFNMIVQPIAFEPGILARLGGNRFSRLAPTLRSDPGDNQVAVAFAQNSRDEVRFINGDGQIAGTLAASSGMKQTNYIAFEPGIAARESNPSQFTEEVIGTLRQKMGDDQTVVAFTAAEARRSGTIRGSSTVSTLTSQAKGDDTGPCVSYGSQVRRLTPIECERLQGFPDNWTDIRAGGKPTPDGPRYKAIGNSMAVPVMRWIGERIKEVEHEKGTSGS